MIVELKVIHVLQMTHISTVRLGLEDRYLCQDLHDVEGRMYFIGRRLVYSLLDRGIYGGEGRCSGR